MRSFKQLLRLEYPKASPLDLKLMLDLVALMKAFEEAATAEANARTKQVEQIFRDIDGDDSGCIDEGEFVDV